jgi:hypothetical protein
VYSMAASAVGRPVEVHAYADGHVMRQEWGSSPSIRDRSAAARRFTIPGITCRCSPAATGMPSVPCFRMNAFWASENSSQLGNRRGKL